MEQIALVARFGFAPGKVRARRRERCSRGPPGRPRPAPAPEPEPSIFLEASVSHASSPARVTLNWSGATTGTVDVYRNGIRFSATANDGWWSVGLNPGTYRFRICEAGSSLCSSEVGVTV